MVILNSCNRYYNIFVFVRLEQEQKELVERKEKELLEQLISQRSGGDVNLSELRSYVQVSKEGCQVKKLSKGY